MNEERELPLLLRAAYMAMHRSTEAALSKHGVTADQFVLLLALAEGKALTQRELAVRISSDPSTVRAMLVLLEKSDLVQRRSHPTDSRAKSVSLTPLGKRKLSQCWKASKAIRSEMTGCLAANASGDLTTQLRLIADTLSGTTAAV